MNVLFTQIGGLTGLFVFLNQMWRYATLEKSIFLAIATGIGVYVVLVLGDLSVRMILHHYPLKDKREGVEKQKTKESGAATARAESRSRPFSA